MLNRRSSLNPGGAPCQQNRTLDRGLLQGSAWRRALADASNHIRYFWDPRMRAKMAEHLTAGGEGLNPLARAAVERVCKPAKTA